MRANLIVGLVVVIVVAVVAVQFDTIESWFLDNEATTSTAIDSPPAPPAQSDSHATTAAEKPDKSAQPEKAVEQTATAEATPNTAIDSPPAPPAQSDSNATTAAEKPDKSAQPEKAVEQTATAEATPNTAIDSPPAPPAQSDSNATTAAEKPDRSAQPEKAVEQTATAEATPQPEPAAKHDETEPDDAAKASDNGVKPPSFDVVRVNPKGDAVIAGRAEPGAEVTVKDADEVLGKVTADKRGEWVLVPEKPLSSGARQLSLQEKTTGGDEKSSKNVVVLFVPERKQSGESNKSEAIVVLTPREGQGASRVLQEPAPSKSDDSAAKSDKDLSLKVIDYDEEGRVVLSGKAPPGSEVRALVDEKTVGTAQADKSGDWQISPSKPVVSGQHAIRIEQVSKSGIVLAKLNVPFSRAIVRTGSLAPGTVVVEAGSSLWRIARATYGEGTKYTLIFAANNEQIGNPNVIFPGQIFVLPPDTASN